MGGDVLAVENHIFSTYHYGSCARGTFISAANQVLGIRGIYVSPEAQFWMHNGFDQITHQMRPDALVYSTRHTPRSLAGEIRAILGQHDPSYHLVYSGAELIARFHYRPC